MGNTALDVVLRGQRDFFPGASVGADFTRGRYKLGKRQFRNPTSIPGWTFTRASTGYAETAAGALTSFASGSPRITDKGLLVEEARTNLCLQSQALATSPWASVSLGTGSAVVATNNYALAPDGTMTATRLQCNLGGGTTSTDQSYQAQPLTGTSCWGSYYIKTNDGTSKNIYMRGATATVVTVTGTWTRYDFSAGSPAGTNFGVGLRGGQSTACSDTCDILVWGAQLEAGSFATSYIPTTTASATRAADVAYISGTNLVPLTAGTLCFESAACLWGADGRDHAALDWLSSDEGLARFSGGYFQIHDGVGYRTANAFSTAGVAAKLAVSYGGTNISASLNGAAVSTYGSFDGSLTANTKLSIGVSDGGNSQWNGYIRRALIYPYAFTNAQLQAATA